MKRNLIAKTLILGGFIWIILLALEYLIPNSHSSWVWHSQQLGALDNISKHKAVESLRELQLDIKKQKFIFLIPAILMLVGGLLNGRKNEKKL